METIVNDSLAQDLANDLADEYANRQPTTPGAFERNGVVYRVQISRESGRAYAKVLRNGHFTYETGAIYNVREIDRLSMDRALEISAQIGACVVCGRALTATKSVLAGIGPVCRNRVR